jgi:hypothetical protein
MSSTRKTLLQRPFAKPARAPAVAGAGPQRSRAAAAQWQSAHEWRSPWPGAVRVSSPLAEHAWRLHFPSRVRPQARACSGCTQGRNRGRSSDGVSQACTMQRHQRKVQRECHATHTHMYMQLTSAAPEYPPRRPHCPQRTAAGSPWPSPLRRPQWCRCPCCGRSRCCTCHTRTHPKGGQR